MMVDNIDLNEITIDGLQRINMGDKVGLQRNDAIICEYDYIYDADGDCTRIIQENDKYGLYDGYKMKLI